MPIPDVPVLPDVVLTVFQRRWLGKRRMTLPWRTRGLAVLAVALSVPAGTTVNALCSLLPSDVLQLSMPRAAWRWVLRWLQLRRRALGSAADHEPWLSFVGSRGRPRQVGWAACQTLHRAKLPGWRLNKLLQANWLTDQMPVPFRRVARYRLAPDSALIALAPC